MEAEKVAAQLRKDLHEIQSQLPTLAQVELEYIQKVLSVMDGNKSATARILGIDRRTLYRKLGRP